MERLAKENAVQDSTIKSNLVRLANAQYQRDLRTKQLAELQLKHNDLEKFAKKYEGMNNRNMLHLYQRT